MINRDGTQHGHVMDGAKYPVNSIPTENRMPITDDGSLDAETYADQCGFAVSVVFGQTTTTNKRARLKERLASWLDQQGLEMEGQISAFMVRGQDRPMQDEELACLFVWLFIEGGALQVEMLDLEHARRQHKQPVSQFSYASATAGSAFFDLLMLYVSRRLPAAQFLGVLATIRKSAQLH